MKAEEHNSLCKDKPLVSVVMSVYNAESTIAVSIAALKNQTYKNIEFIIVNDGSSDQSLAVINRQVNDDPRFKIIDRENRGLIASLNEAIAAASGKYIAREDADDYSARARIAQQVAYMEANPEVIVLGTQSKNFGASQKISRYPVSTDSCKAYLLFSPPLSHPAVIMRKEFLDAHRLGYSESFKHCEDYALWVDISLCGGKLANLDQTLHFYRVHAAQISVVNARITIANHYKLVSRQLEYLGLLIDERLLKYVVLADKSLYETLGISEFRKLLSTYQELITANSQMQIYQSDSLKQVVNNRVKSLVRNRLGLFGLFALLSSEIDMKYTDFLRLAGPAMVRTSKSFLKHFVSKYSDAAV